jgi:hypothetical protein
MRFLRPERIVRLYPRAWRERYEDEMRALLEQTPTSARVWWDLARGLAAEWGRLVSAGVVERLRGPRARMFWRVYGFLGFCYAATVAATFLGSALFESGYRLTALTVSDGLVRILVSLRAFVAWVSVLSGTRRWLLVGRTELMGWALLTISSLSVSRLEQLQFGDTANLLFQALGSFLLLAAGTPAAFADQRCVEARVLPRPSERSDILGLRD